MNTIAGEEVCRLRAAEKWSVGLLMNMISTAISIPAASRQCLLSGAIELLPTDMLKDIPGIIGGIVSVSLVHLDVRAMALEATRKSFVARLRAEFEKTDDQTMRARYLVKISSMFEARKDKLKAACGLEEKDLCEIVDIFTNDFLDAGGLAHLHRWDGRFLNGRGAFSSWLKTYSSSGTS